MTMVVTKVNTYPHITNIGTGLLNLETENDIDHRMNEIGIIKTSSTTVVPLLVMYTEDPQANKEIQFQQGVHQETIINRLTLMTEQTNSPGTIQVAIMT